MPDDSVALHPLLSQRWSPTSFDAEADIAPDELESLLQAARWAPSAGNSQPWSFLVGVRGDDVHDRLVRHLAGSSAAWAPTASVLIANLSQRYVEDTDWEYSEFSAYDLGQAVAHMSLQAAALGFAVRQFRAFDREALTTEFAIPPHWEVTTMSAIGRPRADAGPGPMRTRRADVRWPN
jgi:nitroreductase